MCALACALLPTGRRRFTNYGAVQELMESLGMRYVDVEVVSATNTSAHQTALFNSAGLIVASHSSQLVNMLVMRPEAHIVRRALSTARPPAPTNHPRLVRVPP
jgi:capsular polysaccharide biosynthesis protein